ncbi:hypothetical protein D9M68_875980 [compost metagenome]
MGIRIDPKIKFALDLMGRLQKRSLTAVIEWAISNAISQQTAGSFEQPMSQIVDNIWSTDEATRFVNLCFALPEALSYDELRVWETIKASPPFWNDFSSVGATQENLQMWMVRSNWDSLQSFVEKHKHSATVVPVRDEDLIPF